MQRSEQIQQLIQDAESTVKRIERAGRSVPEWALMEVKLARNALQANERGENPGPALGVLETFKSGNQAEKDAFFRNTPVR